MKKTISKPIQLLVKTTVTIAFLSVLLSFVRGKDLKDILIHLDWFWMVVTFLVTFVMFLASCIKWKIILDLRKKIKFLKLQQIYLIGYFFSNILPSTVGGDVVRSVYAGNILKNHGYAAVSIFVERYSGMVLLFILVIFCPLFYIEIYRSPYIFIPALGSLMGLLFTWWIIRAKEPFMWISRILSSFFLFLQKRFGQRSEKRYERIIEKSRGISEKVLEKGRKVKAEMKLALVAIKNDRRFLWRLILWTVVFYILTWINVYTSFLAFGVHIDFVKVCAVVPVIMLVSQIPVTMLGNLGFMESLIVFYFLMVGMDYTGALAMGLLLRLKTFVLGLFGLAVYLTQKQQDVILSKKIFDSRFDEKL